MPSAFNVQTKPLILILLCMLMPLALIKAFASETEQVASVSEFKWHHGSEDCTADTNPAIQVLHADVGSFVLRQNKCTSFEAPFMYLLLGDKIALLLDTGDAKDSATFPLYQTVSKLLKENSDSSRQLIVLHSHGHLDHRKGDSQFEGIDLIEVIGTSSDELIARFKLNTWPLGSAFLDLGERVVTIIPTPGHHKAAISVYDDLTGWLLTGDTFYPGSIRVSEWHDFRQSINTLTEFAASNAVSHILGGHIEMRENNQGLYKIGSTYQPLELPLALSINDLRELDVTLQKQKKSKKLEFEKYVVAPLSWLEKRMSEAASAVLGN